MSSWKNANKAHQKPHRERHQPAARAHLGLLEKKKDYKSRALDYNSKKAELQYLHKRALDRNPDEFYYHMINSEIDDGVHKEKSKEVTLTPEQLHLMQTQDYRYIANRRTMELKKVEKMQAGLHQLEETLPNQHTFFVDTERDVNRFRLTTRLDTPSALLKRRYNRVRTSDLKKINLSAIIKSPTTLASVGALRHKAYKELEKRQDREKKLLTLQRKMEMKRALQDKSRTVQEKVKPETATSAPVYIWKQERKK